MNHWHCTWTPESYLNRKTSHNTSYPWTLTHQTHEHLHKTKQQHPTQNETLSITKWYTLHNKTIHTTQFSTIYTKIIETWWKKSKQTKCQTYVQQTSDWRIKVITLFLWKAKSKVQKSRTRRQQRSNLSLIYRHTYPLNVEYVVDEELD